MTDETYLAVYDTGGGCVHAVAEDEGGLDAAVTMYLDSAGTRDGLVHLTMLNGQRYVIRASAVQSWIVCTPAGRVRSLEIEKAAKEEDKENRAALGIWEDAA